MCKKIVTKKIIIIAKIKKSGGKINQGIYAILLIFIAYNPLNFQVYLPGK